MGSPSRLQGPHHRHVLQPGKIEGRRNNGKGGRFAGTHRHRSRPLQGALHGPAAQGNSRMDMDTMAAGSAAVPAVHRQPEQETHIVCRGPPGDWDAQELDETFGKLLQSAFSWTEDDDMLWARQLVKMVRKILQQLAGQAMRTRRSPQYGHVPGRQAHEDAWWNNLLSGRYQSLWWIAMSQQLLTMSHITWIIDAMEALKVPPMLVAAWIREYRGPKQSSSWTTSRHLNSSHTICATRRPVRRWPVWGQHWIFQQQHFVKGARWRSGGYLWKRDTWGFFTFRGQLWIIAMSPAELKHSSCLEWTPGQSWIAHRVGRGCLVFIGTGQFGGDHHGVRHSGHSKVAGTGFKTLGAWITFDGHFMKEIAERDVIAWRSFFALRQLRVWQLSGSETSFAPPLIMRGVIHVLVFWQLETYTVTMHSPVGNTRQDAENNDICTKTAHRNCWGTHDTVVKTTA